MIQKQQLVTVKSIALIGLMMPMALVHADTLVGRWCDKFVPNMPQYNHVMTITTRDDGKVMLLSNFADGSRAETGLQEAANRTYEKLESSVGEKYRIDPNSGNLLLIDNDGLIRTATRLQDSPLDDECA